MKIKSITIENFRSIKRITNLPLNNFNVFVGQNNHGKTNFLEAIEWFYNGTGVLTDIKNKDSSEGENINVSVLFDDVQEGLNKMSNEKNKITLEKLIGEEDCIIIKREITKEEGNKRKIKIGDSDFVDHGTGFDKALNDFLPKLEYITTSYNLKDVSKYTSKSQIGQMLGGVVNAILESSDPKYKLFIETFNELFIDEGSRVSQEMSQLAETTKVFLHKQFPDCEKVFFEVKEPKIEDMLKGFDISLDDGHKTTAEEKGDGMQRALMLSIIQTFAEYRRKDENIKNFIFMIDEAELHLHPTAQRNLKNTLLELASNNDQVIITSHSSVLISDDINTQNLFKVEKKNKITNINLFDGRSKPSVIFDLLGGSPADLLLPRNFLLVEGTSDRLFIENIINKHYADKPEIMVIPVWGDIEKVDRVYDSLIHNLSSLDKSLYKERLVILIDKVHVDKENQWKDFARKFPNLISGDQIIKLECESLEEYYPVARSDQAGGHNKPPEWKKQNGHNLSSHQKHSLAKFVSNDIEKDQFENEMPLIFQALTRCWDKSFK